MIPSLNTGGAERTAVSLANWLAENTNDEIYLINLGKNDNNYDINSNVKIYSKKKCTNILDRIKEYIKVISFLNSVKFDIIFEMLFTPLKYAIFHKIFNRKLVIIGSERANPQRYSTLFKKVRCKVAPVFCNGYIFQTNKVKNMFSKYIQKKSVVIPNAISNPDVYNLKKNIKKKKIITSVGRLTYQKGFDTLIRAYIEVYKSHHEYDLIIYGDGPMREELMKLICDNGMEHHIFLPGNCKKLVETIAKSTLFVMCSRFEGMPNALMEAMAIGLPCISTDCIAGPSELIDNKKNGLLVEIDNIEEIKNAILYLIENDTIRGMIANNALDIKKTNAADIIYKKYYDYFESCYNK